MDSLNQQMTIPAVCRIPGKGTAFLVATGVLMTTTAVVASAREAARLTAIFFEGSKKAPVEVKLLPDRLYFSALYPEHVNYCLVACETNGIFNVMPVKVPVVKSDWPQVQEGDTLLLMQHLSSGSGGGAEPTPTTARFDEVLRRRDDLYFLKANGTFTCSGCPAFDAHSRLVGIQSQLQSDGVYVSRILSITTIVKHLFANAMCSKLQQSPSLEAIWDTWYVTNDTTRIISIMANFKTRDVLSVAVQRLCEHTAKSDLLEGVVACGGTRVLVASMNQFKEDESLVRSALRSLWDISFGEVNNRPHIIEAGGVETVLEIMELYPNNQEINEFGIVLLYNLTLEASAISGEWAERCIKDTLAAMCRFAPVEILQKFATGLLANIVRVLPHTAPTIVTEASINHLNGLMREKWKNVLLMENVAPLLASLAKSEWSNPCMRTCIPFLIEIMVGQSSNTTILLSGNNALWSLGADTENRIAILQHPNGSKALAGSVHTLLGAKR